MPGVWVHFSGGKELERQLHGFKATFAKKVVTKAARSAAKPILAKAKALCPVKTGNLKKSLKLRAVRSNRSGYAGVWIAPGTREELGIHKDDPYYYPSAVEFGRRPAGGGVAGKSRKERGANPGMHARPFLRPAFDSLKDSSYRIFREELGVIIDREVARAKAKAAAKAGGPPYIPKRDASGRFT